MTTHNDTTTAEHILRARTLRGIAPDTSLVPFASIGDLLETRAGTQPDDLFLMAYDEAGGLSRWTFWEFNAQVNRMARFLAEQCGVRRGERVATVAHNHPDTVVIYFACWKIGATVAPQNVGEDDARIAFILRNAEARVLLMRPEYRARVDAIVADAPNITTIVPIDETLQQALDLLSPDFTPAEQPTLQDECLLVYTSGTTGAPKGVQLIQYNLLVDAKGVADWQKITPGQRMMCILPIHHVNGILVTLMTPMLVGTSVVLNRAFKASTFWQRVSEQQVAIISVVPTILQFLVEANEDIAGYDLSRLRHLICGAGTLAVTVAQRFEDRFGVRVLHGYGLSETTCYSCFLPTDLSDAEHRRWMRDEGYPSIGVPIDVNEMAIHDPQGQPLPEGERGEIVIRGHNVMIGYFKRPDANTEAFNYGWFRSGDEGFFQRDAQGRPFFFITGRLKELINRGGVKYSPFEIEEVLMAIPGVRVGLAIAFDNLYYGEEVGAYIVLNEGAALTEAEVLARCRAQMPFGKCPKAVIFGTEIPVTSTGKYQRLRLKDRFAAWAETQFRER
jgi:long-chain acyl-CoA synthetase